MSSIFIDKELQLNHLITTQFFEFKFYSELSI